MEKLQLGISGDELTISTNDELRELATSMVRQARQTLWISSRDMDATAFNNADFCNAVTQLATRSRYSQIRILIKNPDPAVKNGHCLLTLAQRLPTYMEIRLFGKDHKTYNQANLIVDRTGFIHRPISDRYEATANFSDRYHARNLANEFQEMWDASMDDPQLRRLSL